MRQTELKEVGLAYNKTAMNPLDVEIKVFLYEHHSFHDDDQMQEGGELSYETTGNANNISTGTAQLQRGITATWLPLGSNRFTAPTLHIGERVRIYKESDTGLYRWTPIGLDESLRRKESIIYGVSACQGDKSVKGRDRDNMYWFEMSSHSQKIALVTNKNLGEATTYQFYFDLKAGKVVLLDDIGNEILIDSTARLISLLNADGTYIKLNKRDIEMYAPKNITVEAGQAISMTAGTTFDIKAGTATSIHTGTTLDMKAGTSTTLTTPIFQGRR